MRAEIESYQDNPTPPNTDAKQITDVPDNMHQWLDDNQERIDNAKQLPPFIEDNKELIEPTKEPEPKNERDEQDKYNFNFANQMAMQNVDIDSIAALSDDIKRTISNNIREVSKKCDLFDNKTSVSFKSHSDGTMMEYKDNELIISTTRYKLQDGTVYCPAEQVHAALLKLKAKKQLTFKEEYAVESLFHESVHSKSTGHINYDKGNVGYIVYETCTQLYAREKYKNVLLKMGVTPTHFEDIKQRGYGYNKACNILRGVFTVKDVLQVGELKGIANKTIDGKQALEILCKKRGYNYSVICDLLFTMIP